MTLSAPGRRLLLLLAALAVAAGTTVAVSTAASAAGIQCSTQVESRQPVLLVHGYNSGPQTWSGATLNTYAHVGGICLDVFDYRNWSTHWVTDSHIGPALAGRLTELGTASSAAGGSGKVVVVAHSMGGLATRCALDAGCNGGVAGVSSRVRELITFGTPNTGTWLRGHGVQYASASSGASLLSATCYASFNGANPICQQIRAVGTSTAAKAFTPGSEQLRALPAVPSGIPVFAMAAHVEAVTSVFGWQAGDIGDVGDLIVKEDSALDEGVRYGKLGGVQTIDCGAINVLRLSGQSCWHSTETNDTRFLSAAVAQIRLAAQPAPARPTPSPTTPRSTPPPTTSAPRTSSPPPVPSTTPPAARAFTPGSAFDDDCVVNWPTAPQYTSTSIGMIMGCLHVPQAQFFYTEVVYDDPTLAVTPSTGRMHVVGKVVDVATSAYGFKVLQVHATQIIL